MSTLDYDSGIRGQKHFLHEILQNKGFFFLFFFFFFLVYLTRKSRYSLRLDFCLFSSFLFLLFIPQLNTFFVDIILQQVLLVDLSKYRTRFWPCSRSICLGFSKSSSTESYWTDLDHMPSTSKTLVLEQMCFELRLPGSRVYSFSSVCTGHSPYKPDITIWWWCILSKLQPSPTALLTVISHLRVKDKRSDLISIHASTYSLCSLHPVFLECSLETLGRFQFRVVFFFNSLVLLPKSSSHTCGHGSFSHILKVIVKLPLPTLLETEALSVHILSTFFTLFSPEHLPLSKKLHVF